MKKRTAFLAIVYVIAVAALSLLVIDLIAAHRRINIVESQTGVGELGSTPQQSVSENNRQTAAAATQFSKSISGVHETLAKASPHKRTKIITGQQAQEETARRREVASNRTMVSAWSADDVAEQLKRKGLVLAVTLPYWQPDPAANAASDRSTNPAPDNQQWGVICQTADGKSSLVARVDNQPQRQRTAIATCKASGLRPYSWGSFVLGFTDDVQRDTIVAALPRID